MYINVFSGAIFNENRTCYSFFLSLLVTHLKYMNYNKDFSYFFKGNSALAKWWRQHKQNTCVVLHQPFTGYNSQFLFVDKHSSVYGFEELLSAGGNHSWGKKMSANNCLKALGYSSVWSFNHDTHEAHAIFLHVNMKLWPFEKKKNPTTRLNLFMKYTNHSQSQVK